MNVNSLEDGNDLAKMKVTHDPGWNDPPVFSYDAVTAIAQSKTPKRGLLLNKRVAFPLSSQPPSDMPPTMPANSIPSGIMLGQPPIAGHPTTARNTTDENAGQSFSLQKEDALQRVMEGFEHILQDSAHDFQKNGSEIRRRLEVMKKMWEEDKLKPEIYVKMVKLTEALRNGNGELADHIHISIMVDHVSLCSPWMVGVRQLIHHIKSQAVKQEEMLCN